MAELERIANHLGDIGAICNDAAFALMHAHCGILREQVLAACDAAFGHRLMMDRIVPGGVAQRHHGRRRDAPSSPCSTMIEPRFAEIVAALRRHAVAAGSHLHHRHRGSPISSRAGRRRLCRPRLGPRLSMRARDLAYPPYDGLALRRAGARPAATSMRASGCASARSRRASRLRARAGSQLCRADRSRSRCPPRPSRAKASLWSRPSAATCSSGCACADGRVARCHVRDASWLPVAAARGRDRGQHRRRLPAVQQVVQLLLFGARRLMRTLLLDRCSPRPVTIAAPSPDAGALRGARRSAATRARAGCSAARSRSARSMPARATAASWKSTRSTTRSTTSSASA